MSVATDDQLSVTVASIVDGKLVKNKVTYSKEESVQQVCKRGLDEDQQQQIEESIICKAVKYDTTTLDDIIAGGGELIFLDVDDDGNVIRKGRYLVSKEIYE